MEPVYQEQDARCCGQVALANLTCFSLDEICKLVGHRKGTKTRDLVRVLRQLGWQTDGKLRRYPRQPTFAIGKLRHRRGKEWCGWHWVSVRCGRIHYGYAPGTLQWMKAAEGHVTTWLLVMPPFEISIEGREKRDRWVKECVDQSIAAEERGRQR